MSYSFNIEPTDKLDVTTALDKKVSELPSGNADDERDEHLRAIGEAVLRLLPVVGREQDHVTLSVSGHSNVDHAPSDEWADEMISINISVVSAKHVLSKDCPCAPEVEVIPDYRGLTE